MNERLKELAEQVGATIHKAMHGESVSFLENDLERFVDLVRQDERDKCAQDYLQDCCNAIDAARLEDREACAKFLDDFTKTEMVPVKDTWRRGVMAAANAVRDKK